MVFPLHFPINQTSDPGIQVPSGPHADAERAKLVEAKNHSTKVVRPTASKIEGKPVPMMRGYSVFSLENTAVFLTLRPWENGQDAKDTVVLVYHVHF